MLADFHAVMCIKAISRGVLMANSSDRSFDMQKVIISILAAVLTVVFGGWLTLLHARVTETERRSEISLSVANSANTKIEAVSVNQSSTDRKIDDLKKDMSERLNKIENKIENLYSPSGKRR